MLLNEKHITIRNRIRDTSQSVSQSSLQLAWDLGAVKAEALWRGWLNDDEIPFESFDQWREKDMPHLSRSHCYALAGVGVTFRPYKAELDSASIERKCNVTQLIQLRAKIEAADPPLDVAVLVEHVVRGEQPPLPVPEVREGEGAFTEIKFVVKTVDAAQIRQGLMIHAARNGYRTRDEALASLAIGETLDPSLPSHLERFRDLIEKGEFNCRLCGQIPSSQPTLHHCLPRSIGQGDGPQVLLCWEPCHKDTVQPQWQKYAKRWMGKDEFNRVLNELKSRGVA